MNVRTHLDEVLSAYLEEFGPDGYDKQTFIDYVVAHVIDPGDAPKMIAWYRKRAADLEVEMNTVTAEFREARSKR